MGNGIIQAGYEEGEVNFMCTMRIERPERGTTGSEGAQASQGTSQRIYISGQIPSQSNSHKKHCTALGYASIDCAADIFHIGSNMVCVTVASVTLIPNF